MSARFTWPVRVYYEDTDGGGVVYHANYLKFMERARTEWLRSLGYAQTELRSAPGVIFVVREIGLQYRQPARFDDALLVHSELLDVGRSLLRFRQTVLRDETVLAEAGVLVVCVDAARFRPVAIPASLREKIMEST